MKHYKAPDNSIHAIEPEYQYMLPSGSIEITNEEADLLRTKPNAVQIIESKLAKVRATREQVLDRLAGIAGRAHRAGNMDLAIACDIAAEELLDITKPPIEDPEQFDAIIMARYAAIVEPYLPTGETPMPELLRAFSAFDE